MLSFAIEQGLALLTAKYGGAGIYCPKGRGEMQLYRIYFAVADSRYALPFCLGSKTKSALMKKRSLKILIVDNDAAIRGALRRVLNRENVIIKEAENGRQALEKVKEIKPDIIILDVEMPIMDGFETYRHLRGNLDTINIPIIFISGNPTAGDIIKNIQRGPVEFIEKPFEVADIRQRIRILLKIDN